MIFSLFGRKSASRSQARAAAGAHEPVAVRSRGLSAKIDAIESEMIHNGPASQFGPVTLTGSTRALNLETGVAGRVYVPSARSQAVSADSDSLAPPLDPLQHLPADLRASLAVPGALDRLDPPEHLPSLEMQVDPKAIEIASPDWPAALEEAAVLYSNAQFDEARRVLERALHDLEASEQVRQAWLMLLDLHQGLGDAAAFERLAMQFAERFETSPPSWDEERAGSALRDAASVSSALSITLPVRLDAEAAAGLGRVPETLNRSRPLDLDLRPVRDLDVGGAHWLCEALRHLGEPGAPVRILGADSLLTLLTPKIQKDRRDPVEPLWWLGLELLRVLDRPQAFEDCAIDYCVTYEVSPPPWSPRAAHIRAGLGGHAPEPSPSCGMPAVRLLEAEGRLVLRGDLGGRSAELLAGLRRLALTHPVVHLDARMLQRLDFSTAGDLLNEVLSLQAAGKRVRISGVGPMVEGLLAVMGVTQLVAADRRG